MDQIKSFEDYERDALLAISNANTADELEAVRIEFLGKKQGRLKDLQGLLGNVPPDQRPAVGKRFNEIKDRKRVAQYMKAPPPLTLGQILSPEDEG